MSKPQPALISAEQLIEAIEATSMDARGLVKKLLTAPPHDSKGRKTIWPALSTLRVKDILESRVQVPGSSHDAHVSGFYAAALILATTAAVPLVHSGVLGADGYQHSDEQLEAFYAACRRILQGNEELTALDMLLYAPVQNGFYRGYLTYDHDRLEEAIRSAIGEGADRHGVCRLLDAVQADGNRYTVWRTGYESVCGAGEKVYDVSALQTDVAGRPRAYADLRVVSVPQGIDEQEAFWVLDAYDDEGLELGYGLKQLVRQGLVSRGDLFDGRSVVHLQAFEVRQELRGHGVGATFLQNVLPVALKGLRRKPGHFVATVAPMQFDHPLDPALPADFLMEALDCTEALLTHLRAAQLAKNVPSLRGQPLIALPQDSRTFGTHLEQLRFLSENCD